MDDRGTAKQYVVFGIIFLLAFVIYFVGCVNKTPSGQVEQVPITKTAEYTAINVGNFATPCIEYCETRIDGCEYIFSKIEKGWVVIHKQNCDNEFHKITSSK